MCVHALLILDLPDRFKVVELPQICLKTKHLFKYILIRVVSFLLDLFGEVNQFVSGCFIL